MRLFVKECGSWQFNCEYEYIYKYSERVFNYMISFADDFIEYINGENDGIDIDVDDTDTKEDIYYNARDEMLNKVDEFINEKVNMWEVMKLTQEVECADYERASNEIYEIIDTIVDIDIDTEEEEEEEE